MKKFLSIIVAALAVLQAAGQNRHYAVSICEGGNWNELDVRDALCSDSEHHHDEMWTDWDNSKGLRDTMSYAIYEHDFSSELRVRVTKPDGFRNAEIRPSTYGIIPLRTAPNTIEFTIPSADRRKVSVEFDGDRQHNLFLIGHEFETEKPSLTDDNVIYFGPGEHEVGEITMTGGQTLYIDYGATVYGTVRITGSNCTVAGHGVLSGARLPHHGDIYSNGPCLLIANNFGQWGKVENLTFRDLTMIDSPSWNLTVFDGENILVDGVNMISWELNGDGVDLVCCQNSVVRNCFLRNYDDCITLKVRGTARQITDLCNVQIYDNLIFNDYARGIVVGIENGNTSLKGRNTGRIHDVEIRDCIILQSSRTEDITDLRAGIAIGMQPSPEHIYLKGTARTMSNIYIHDIVFDHLNPTGRCLYILQYKEMQSSCLMENILLENFRVLGGRNMNTPAGLIVTHQHKISNLTVRNFVVDGKKIKNRGLDFVVVGDADVKFE